MKRVTVTVLACVAFGVLAVSKEPQQKHKCNGFSQNPARIIVEETEVVDLKLLNHPPFEISKECEGKAGLYPELSFELLIDERGNVECVELLSEAIGLQPCVLEGAKDMLRHFKYSVPKTQKGNVVACHAAVTMNVNPVK